MNESFPIPRRKNLLLVTLQLAGLCFILVFTSRAQTGWPLALLCLAYGLLMNSAYAMLHEAEHQILHPNRMLNDTAGALLALFFPAPFHLIRQGHLGHHLRNRSDDEVFDFYFEEENAFWKHLQFYGVLTGLFYITVAFSCVLGLVCPWIFQPSKASSFGMDRATESLFASLNERYLLWIWIESLLACLLHGSLMIYFKIPMWKYAFVLFGFGGLWSAMQYVHHYGAVRDVLEGAKNLKTFGLLDLLWLNHNWHLRHHQNPTLPWVYLPLAGDRKEARENLFLAYLKMWKGPEKTTLRVRNRYDGRIIR